MSPKTSSEPAANSENPHEIPFWIPTSVPNLFRHRKNQRFYARLRVNGKGTWRALKTSVFTVASIKMAKITGEVAKAKLDAPVTSTNPSEEIRTMGDLARVFLARVDAAPRSPGTKTNWRVWHARLVAAWPGRFEAALPNQVNLDFILRLRAGLLAKEFTITNTKRKRKGYSNGAVNQTLTVLKLLLQLAKEHHLIFSSPFDDQDTVFGGKIWLPKNSRKPELPSRFDMERVFAEIGTVPEFAGVEKMRRQFMEEQARDASEHARFLAFSGGRLNECNAAKWEHIGVESFTLYGTKSRSSERLVPIVMAMRELLNEMRTRRIAMNFHLRGTILRVKGCRHALQRACARVGISKMTHHDLRHYFITVCIESGVDIPTIARWVGHSDGGALLMKTYAHLRDLHSAKMGAQVSFGPATTVSAISSPQSTAG